MVGQEITVSKQYIVQRLWFIWTILGWAKCSQNTS
jgi:hypothetical protein